jgi:hypothetical protein
MPEGAEAIIRAGAVVLHRSVSSSLIAAAAISHPLGPMGYVWLWPTVACELQTQLDDLQSRAVAVRLAIWGLGLEWKELD